MAGRSWCRKARASWGPRCRQHRGVDRRPLTTLLDEAGVRPWRCRGILTASDKGDPMKEGQPPGAVAFARQFAVWPRRAGRRCWLAYAWNGADITPEHGSHCGPWWGGWYGIGLGEVADAHHRDDQALPRFDQRCDYAYWEMAPTACRL